jgi:hypothetical protein
MSLKLFCLSAISLSRQIVSSTQILEYPRVGSCRVRFENRAKNTEKFIRKMDRFTRFRKCALLLPCLVLPTHGAPNVVFMHDESTDGTYSYVCYRCRKRLIAPTNCSSEGTKRKASPHPFTPPPSPPTHTPTTTTTTQAGSTRRIRQCQFLISTAFRRVG